MSLSGHVLRKIQLKTTGHNCRAVDYKKVEPTDTFAGSLYASQTTGAQALECVRAYASCMHACAGCMRAPPLSVRRIWGTIGAVTVGLPTVKVPCRCW